MISLCCMSITPAKERLSTLLQDPWVILRSVLNCLGTVVSWETTLVSLLSWTTAMEVGLVAEESLPSLMPLSVYHFQIPMRSLPRVLFMGK